MFNSKKKKEIINADQVIFLKDIETTDMFGGAEVIPKGTIGIISGVNIIKTVYDAKYYDNVEVIYGNRQRVLLIKYWNVLKPVS